MGVLELLLHSYILVGCFIYAREATKQQDNQPDF